MSEEVASPQLRAPSLILQTAQDALRTDEQLSLFCGEAKIEPIDREAVVGDYTGERFYARRPETYKLCVEMLADPSISVRQICKVLHVTDGTVNAVRAREETLRKAHAKILSGKLEVGMHAAFERAMEALPGASALQAATVGAIMVDKHALINGQATARVEMVAKIDFGAELQKMHQQAADIFANMKKAEVISEVGTRNAELEEGATNETLALEEAL